MVSKSDLLEKRLRSPAAHSVKEVRPIEEVSLVNVVNYVHQLSNELWNDVHIFGPHQQQENSPRKFVAYSPDAKDSSRKSPQKRCSRSDELFSELSEERMARLDEISSIYSECLNKNICPSLLDEVHLWLQLLTENYDSTMSSFAPQDHLFSTVSSRSYFVKKVLESQIATVVVHLDTHICQLLIRNYAHRIPKLMRKQLEKIVSIHQASAHKIDEALSSPLSSSDAAQSNDRVTFVHETDGRSNFVNQNDFHSFCKQRDIFYAIKDLWTKGNKTPSSNKFADSNFSPTQASPTKYNRVTTPKRTTPHGPESGAQAKMKQMIQLTSSPTNLVHLAALTLSQYLLDCSHFNDYGDIAMADENIRQIFQNNPSKFKQLENRFPGSGATANDPFQFFQYFLQLASWPEFNQHLMDRCLLELDEIEARLDSQEARSPKEIIDSLKRSRIVAQLLGVLHFRPYQRHCQPILNKSVRSIEFETSMQRQVRLRSYQQPPADLQSKIFASLVSKKLIFTLTWILEFLVQADSVAFYLPSYKRVLELITELYRTLLSVPNSSPLCRSNQAFLRFYCGNLFGRSDFPSELIFTAKLSEDQRVSQYLSRRKNSDSKDQDEEDVVLDSFQLIGEVLNGIIFDKQMSALKDLLSTSLSPVKKSSGNITPVSVLPVKRNIRPIPLSQVSPTKSAGDQIGKTPEAAFQLQLEASFFQSHPSSVKRTVEFIAERLASNFVKTLRLTLYPEFRDECFEKGIFGEEAVGLCQRKILATFKASCFPMAEQAVNLLIGDNLNVGGIRACKELVARKSLERIREWTNTHINTDLFPEGKIGESVAKRQLVLSAATASNDVSQAKFHALVHLQKTLQRIHKSQLEPGDLREFLNVLNPSSLGVSGLVVTSTVDVILALITFTPDFLTSDVEDAFIEYWKLAWKPSIKILCPRNVLLLEQAQDSTGAWARVTKLVKRLVTLSIIDIKNVESICLGFMRHEWPVCVLHRISEFSKSISGGASTRTEESEVIDWIAWACSSEEGF